MNIYDRVPGGINPVDEFVRLMHDGPDRRPIPSSVPAGRFMLSDPAFAWSRRVIYRALRCMGHLFAAFAYKVDPDAALPGYRRTAIDGELYLAGNYWRMARAMIRGRARDVIRSIEMFRARTRGAE